MIRLPGKFSSNHTLTAADLNQIVDCIRALVPRGDGKTIKVATNSFGSAFSLLKQSNNSANTNSTGDAYNGFFKVEKSIDTENSIIVNTGFAIIHNLYTDVETALFSIDGDCFINFKCPYTLPVYGDDGIITGELTIGTPELVKEASRPSYEESVFKTVIAEIKFDEVITNIIQHQYGAILGTLSDFYDAISDQQQKTQQQANETQAQANENRGILSDISDFIGLDDLNEFLEADLSTRDDLGTYGMVALLVPSGYIYSYGLEEWHATGDVSFYPESGVHYIPINSSSYNSNNTATHQYRAMIYNGWTSVNAGGGAFSGDFLWELDHNQNTGILSEGLLSGSASDDFEHILGSTNSYASWVYSSPSFEAEKVKARIKWHLTPPE